MRIDAHVDDIRPLDESEICIGTLVESIIDPRARGVVVEFLTRDIVSVLWSTPPQNTLGVDHRDIW